ncbi:MAG: ATP-binding protein, partial [Tissierellia bacterium]|nr:ATP-binding protein [Tissierellia bacterium]
MDDRLYREINLEYQKLRDRKERELEERKEELFSALPTLKELEEEISRLGFFAVKEQLAGNHENINSYKQEIYALGEMKKKILVEAGLPDHYLELEYQCEKCEDTGYLPSGNRCDCFKQKLATRLYNMSNLQYVLEKENFQTFDIQVFSQEIIKEEGISPRENMTFILDVVEQFIRNFPKQNDENLLFYGATGLGKTYLSNCIAKELLDQGYTVIYQTAFTFLDILES